MQIGQGEARHSWTPPCRYYRRSRPSLNKKGGAWPLTTLIPTTLRGQDQFAGFFHCHSTTTVESSWGRTAPGGCFQAKALDLLYCTLSRLARSDESQACLLLASHSFCEGQTAGTVPRQDSSTAWEHWRMNVTFLNAKDHQLFFTFYYGLSVFMETTAKEKERRRLFVLSGIQSAHWAVRRCKSPHRRSNHPPQGCAKASGNHPRLVIRDSFWQHLPWGFFGSHSKPSKQLENTKKPSWCGNAANTCTVSDSGESTSGKAPQIYLWYVGSPRPPWTWAVTREQKYDGLWVMRKTSKSPGSVLHTCRRWDWSDHIPPNCP